MAEPRKIDFNELEPMVQTGHKWRFRRFLQSAQGVFGSYGVGTGLAGLFQTIAVGAGMASGLAAAIFMPVISIPVAFVYLLVIVRDQVKTRGQQKSRWKQIFGDENSEGLLKRLRRSLQYFIDNGIWVDGFYDALNHFSGDTLVEKLKNIFGDEYDEIGDQNLLVQKFNQIQERFSVMQTFLDRYEDQVLDYEEDFATCLANEIEQLTLSQYEALEPQLTTFMKNNDWLKFERRASVVLNKIEYPIERPTKDWKYYLEHGAKTVLAAFMGAVAGFGFVTGIGVIMGITTLSFTGIGFGILVGAIVLAVVFSVFFVALKKYVDDKENDISDALLDGGRACEVLSSELERTKGLILEQKREGEYGQEAFEAKRENLSALDNAITEATVPLQTFPPKGEAKKYHKDRNIFNKPKKIKKHKVKSSRFKFKKSKAASEKKHWFSFKIGKK